MNGFYENERKAICGYKYVGGDQSLLYGHVLSPLAAALVESLPKNVAPNLITFAGLLFPIFASVATLVVNPSLMTTGPRDAWLHLLTGVNLFVYQTLDNMDGKQARRTSTSSAHGMLFDHGCDALQGGISSITLSSALGLGWAGAFLFSWTTYIPFYLMSWEHLHTGKMFLPVINGPSEGLLIAVAICCTSFFTGGGVWWHVVGTFAVGQWVSCITAPGILSEEYAMAILQFILQVFHFFLHAMMTVLDLMPGTTDALLPMVSDTLSTTTRLVDVTLSAAPVHMFLAFISMAVGLTALLHLITVFTSSRSIISLRQRTMDALVLVVIAGTAAWWISRDAELHASIDVLTSRRTFSMMEGDDSWDWPRIYPLLVLTILGCPFVEAAVGLMVSGITGSRRHLTQLAPPSALITATLGVAAVISLNSASDRAVLSSAARPALRHLTQLYVGVTNLMGIDLSSSDVPSSDDYGHDHHEGVDASGYEEADEEEAGGGGGGEVLSHFQSLTRSTDEDGSCCSGRWMIVLATTCALCVAHFGIAALYSQGKDFLTLARAPKIMTTTLLTLSQVAADVHRLFGLVVCLSFFGQHSILPALSPFLQWTTNTCLTLHASLAPLHGQVMAWGALAVAPSGSVFPSTDALRMLGLVDLLIPSLAMASVFFTSLKLIALSRIVADVIGLTYVLRMNEKKKRD